MKGIERILGSWHGPEEQDRWCRKHYDRHDYCFANFGRRSGECHDCAEEERLAWLEDLQQRLEHGLAMAAQGFRVVWPPQPDAPETILARMMDLQGAPLTFAATMAWVHNYLGKGQPHETHTTGP